MDRVTNFLSSCTHNRGGITSNGVEYRITKSEIIKALNKVNFKPVKVPYKKLMRLEVTDGS